MRRIHLWILFLLAVFQPIFEQLRMSPEFFLANHNTPVDIMTLFLLFWLVIPLLLMKFVSVVHHFSRKAGDVTHVILFALFLLAAVLFALNRTVNPPALAMMALAVLLAGVITAGYVRFASIRSFVTFLFPILIVAPGIFLSNGFILKLIRPEKSISKTSTKSGQAPVMLIILDELPLSSLLNEKEEIDSIRYPHFAQLASESHWFRNATTVAGFTSEAVPAILTGRYPEMAKIPMFFDHPENLFVLLSGTHHVIALETATRLCPGSICEGRISSFQDRFELLLSDVFVLYSHLVLPPDWADRIFPIEDLVIFARSPEDRLADFKGFMTHMKTPSDLPPFFFVHVQLPHYPWRFLPSGEEMSDSRLEELKRKVSDFFPGRTAELFPLERHLLQVGLVDRLLGRALHRLKELDLYDPALLVVTSDHGLLRSASDEQLGGINGDTSSMDDSYRSSWENMLIPLFVKVPYQKTGAVSDRNVESIDIVPTIADVLGLKAPWAEGDSAFSAIPERPDKYFFEDDRKIRMDAHLSVDRKILSDKLVLDSLPMGDFLSEQPRP